MSFGSEEGVGGEGEDLDGGEPDELEAELDDRGLLEGLSPAARAELVEDIREVRASAARGMAVAFELLGGERLRAAIIANEVARRANEHRDAAIVAAHDLGHSWADLARVLGTTRQALHQRYRRP